jgi:hypothetical protein
VRFDESRMFNFLYALKDMPAAPATYRAIEVALEALDVPDFIDLPRLIAQHGPKCAVQSASGQQAIRFQLELTPARPL